MNAPQPAHRSTAAVVVQSLMWLWLIGLSVLVALGYQAMNDQADQERLDSRLQRLEAQATGLAETVEAIQQRPAVATAADLKDIRQFLEARACAWRVVAVWCMAMAWPRRSWYASATLAYR